MKQTRVRTPRRADVVEVIGALMVVCALAAVLVGWSRPDPAPSTSVSVSVKQGDTLWDIAASHPAPGMTTDQIVDAIISLNDLTGAPLQPGTTLSVPVPVDANPDDYAMR